MLNQKLTTEKLKTIFENVSLAFNPLLAEETRNLINAYETEKSTQNHTITITYSPETAVDRVWNGETKNFYPKHRNSEEDSWTKKVGDINNWLPYRYSDVQYCQNKIALIHEGEKATDYARFNGLISFCFLGAKCQDEQFLENNLLELKKHLAGAIYIVDNDDAGMKKAHSVQKIARKINFPVLVLPIKTIYPQASKGDDIVEFFQENSDLSPQILKADIEDAVESYLTALIKDYLTEESPQSEQLPQILTSEEAVSQAREILGSEHDEIKLNTLLNDVRKQTDFSEFFWENKIIKPLKRKIKQERLVLELQAFLQEPDPIKRVYLKQSVCCNYSISSKDFESLSNHIEQKNNIPEKIVFDGEEFFDLPDDEEEWLIPSILPKGEMLLLTALPKVGKSLLACDLVHAVLTGEKVLGESALKSKVLYVGSDESRSSLKRRMRARGIDLIEDRKKNLKVVTYLDLTDTCRLEQELEDFHPDLVIIDSLTSTTLSLGISEKDAEFAKPIYRLKDLLKKYNCASVLIHHENKSKDSKGICKVSGSARITAAVWGIAQMSGNENLTEENQSLVANANLRSLALSPREGEKVTFNLNINPKDLWGEQGIFEFLGEADDPNGQKKTQGNQVMELLKTKSVPLEYAEIDECLGIGRHLYTVLDRLVDRRLISKRRSQKNPRRFVYLIENESQQHSSNNIDIKENFSHTPPSPSNLSSDKKINPESIENKEIEVIPQVIPQLVHTSENENEEKSNSNQDIAKDSELVHNFYKNQQGGGVNDDIATENDDDSNCKNGYFIENEEEIICNFMDNKDCFMGLKVKHKDTPEIEGEIISELCKVGLNFMVTVQWLQPRPQLHGWQPQIEENCLITTLISDEIDWEKWTNIILDLDRL